MQLIAWTHAGAQGEPVVVGQVVVEPERIRSCARDREIADQTVQRHEEAGTKQSPSRGGHEVGKPLSLPRCRPGPFQRHPGRRRSSAVYCPTWSCPNSGLKILPAVPPGVVRNPTCCGVSCTVPNVWPTCVVSNGPTQSCLPPSRKTHLLRQVPS